MYISPAVSGGYDSLGVIHHLWFLQPFCLVFFICELEGKALMKISGLGLKAAKSLLTANCPIVHFGVNSYILQEQASLIMTK